MGFRNNTYAKVWRISHEDNGYIKLNISISRKPPEGQTEFIKEFNGWCSIYGKAKEKIQNICEGDQIFLKSVDVTNKYNKDKDFTFVNYKIFDFDPVASNKLDSEPQPSYEGDNSVDETSLVEDDTPF